MPKKLPPKLSQKIFAFIASNSEGLVVEQLFDLLNGEISRRTIQRRLKELVQTGQIMHKAGTRRYWIVAEQSKTSTVEDPDLLFFLSKTSQEVQASVKRPLVERTPVGYNRRFLESYRPNKVAYLSEELRDHLARLGKTSGVGQPAGTYARNILQRLMIDLSWASSRLEGNTYSLLETEKLIEIGEAAQGKDLAETQMIQNHKAAIEYLVDSASDLSISPFIVRNLHALLSDNLLQNPAACGRLRVTPVGIGGSTYIPLENGQLIQDFFDQLTTTADLIQNPFEQSFFLMVHLPYLQPFDDVNKRVSRLAATIPLIKNNLCPLSFMDMPESIYIDGIMAVYELNRVELLRDAFVWAYERSSQRYGAILQSLGDPDPFRQRYRNQLISIIKKVIQERIIPSTEYLTAVATALQVPGEHTEHLVRVLLTELGALHEGNFARYKVRPSEFILWKSHVGDNFFTTKL